MLLETERYASIRRKIGHPSPPPVSLCPLLMGSRDSLLVRVPDSWSKGCEFESQWDWRENFFSRLNSVCWRLFSVHSTLVLPQWHVKDPCHSTKSAGGRLHLNTLTPLTQRSRNGSTMPLSRYSVGTYPETAHTKLVREHSVTVIFSSLNHCGLILA